MKQLKKLKENNSGWGLLELLVVFSLVTVVTSIASFSLALTPGTSAKELLYSLDSMISRTKTGSITKAGDVYMEVSNDGKNIVIEYYEDGLSSPKERNVLGDNQRGVKLYYKMKDTENDTETDYTELTKDKSIYFAFDRRTTGFLSLNESAKKDSASSSKWTAAPSDKYYCVELMVTVGDYNAGNSILEYHIELGPVTGTHYKDLK